MVQELVLTGTQKEKIKINKKAQGRNEQISWDNSKAENIVHNSYVDLPWK